MTISGKDDITNLDGPPGPKEYKKTGTRRTARIVHPIEISGVREDGERSSSDEPFQFINNPESQCSGIVGPEPFRLLFMDNDRKSALERKTAISFY